MTTALDVAPLTTSLPVSAVQAWRARAKASGAAWATTSAQQVLATIAAIIIGLTMVVLFGNAIGGMLVGGIRDGNWVVALFAVLFLVVGVVVVVAVVRLVLRGPGRWARWARIDAFAHANGLVFSPQDPPPGYRGLIFGLGHDQVVLEHVRTTSGRFVDMGGYQYVTGSGRDRSTHRWGYLAIQLDRRPPNIVLDSKANNGLLGVSNLPVALARDQILHLEGDFDQHFTLYCPSDYETDALYVFTPDLMALLIDEAAPFDVEIVDDWFFAYAAHPLDMADPATYERMFRIVDTVGAKTVDQTENYRDDRVGDPAADIVSPQGARLRHGVSVGAIVAIVIVLGWAGWSFLSSALGW